MSRSCNYITAVVAALSVTVCACSPTPDHVIPPDRMAPLIADIYKGESVIEFNRATYNNDSMKKVMKQSVFARHGVTSEQVDTSFVWYGHHVEEYIKVYDRVIEILENDLDKARALDTSGSLQMAVAGDSVDTWQSARHYKFNTLSPAEYISFAIDRDDTWEKGDSYLWQFKLLNGRSKVTAMLGVDYENGPTEFTTNTSDDDGWTKIRLTVDSTRTPSRLYGYLRVNTAPDENMYIDSVSLIRTRVNPLEYSRRYKLKKFNYGKPAPDNE